MVFLVILTSIVCLTVTFVLWMRKRFSYWKEMGAPYEEPSFLYGNLKGVGKQDHDGQLIEKFYRKHKGRGPFVGIFFFLVPVVVPIDLDLVKNILIRDFNYFHDRGLFYNEKDDPLSGHLFTLPGLRWRQIRNKLSPAFTSGKMKTIFPLIVKIARRLELKFDEICTSESQVDIKDIMARFTIDVIGTCAYGLEANCLEDGQNEFFHVGMSVFENPRHGTGFTLLLLAFREYARKLGFKTFRDEVIKFYSSTIRKVVDYRLANNIERGDFMDILIKLHMGGNEEPLSFNELLAQAFVFHSAGFETSSSTLQFCFYELACNPAIQEQTRSHINEVLGEHGGELTYEAVADMKYLDQVIAETLRLYPPAGNHIREVTQDYKVPGTDFILKKGTSVMIPIYAIQRDAEYFPNPTRFNPDNFTEENIKSRPFAAYLPFGEGPHMCIGARFAMMQVKVGLVTGLCNYKYTLSERTGRPLKLQSKFFLTNIDGGIWLNIERLK